MTRTGKMLIASRVRDGRVVFRAVDGSWVESIAAGELIDAAAAEDRLAAGHTDERHNHVVDPYLIDVVESREGRRPSSGREAIRAFGPTVSVTGR